MFKTNCKITIEKSTDEEIKLRNKIHEYCWKYADEHQIGSILKFFGSDGYYVTTISCPLCGSNDVGIDGTIDEITEIWCYDCGASRNTRTTFDWFVDTYDNDEIVEMMENDNVSKN